MTLFEDTPDELKMLEGRRKYMTGSKKRLLPLLISALCGALCTFVVVMAYVGSRQHGNSDVMVTFGDDKNYQGALYLTKVGNIKGTESSEESEKRVVPDLGSAPAFLNMIPKIQQKDEEKNTEEGHKMDHEGWNAVPKVPAFVNMVPHIDKMKPDDDEKVVEGDIWEGVPSKTETVTHSSEQEEKEGMDEGKNDEKKEGKDDEKDKGRQDKEDKQEGKDNKDDEDGGESDTDESNGDDKAESKEADEEQSDGRKDGDSKGDEHPDDKDNADMAEDASTSPDNKEHGDAGADEKVHPDEGKDERPKVEKPQQETSDHPKQPPSTMKDGGDRKNATKPRVNQPKKGDVRNPEAGDKVPQGMITVEEAAESNEEVDTAYAKLLAYDKRIESLPKRYELKSRQKIGIPFKEGILAWSHLKDSPKFSEPFALSTALDNLVFVTGCSRTHFSESQDAIAGVQKVFPHAMTLYYDLGLDPYQVDQVKGWCNVLYRKFDFDKYPDHVKDLYTYAFKPLIIKEVLNQHSNILWIDASYRPNTDKISGVYNHAKRFGGIVLAHNSAENITSATHPDMFLYIPTARYKLRRMKMASAGIIFCRNTPKVYWGVLYWWFLCALEERCIAPEDAGLECKIDTQAEKNRPGEYRGCHRYDQSALNILLANYFKLSRDKYVAPYKAGKEMVKDVDRKVTHENVLQRC